MHEGAQHVVHPHQMPGPHRLEKPHHVFIHPHGKMHFAFGGVLFGDVMPFAGNVIRRLDMVMQIPIQPLHRVVHVIVIRPLAAVHFLQIHCILLCTNLPKTT